MDAKWKSSFGRSRTPMGAVPISVIYGYKYPLSPVPPPRVGPSTPPSQRGAGTSSWPSCLATPSYRQPYQPQPPQVVPARKFPQADTATSSSVLRKTRGCLSQLTSSRLKPPAPAAGVEAAEVRAPVTACSYDAGSCSFRKPNIVSSRARTVDPIYSSHNNYSTSLASYRAASRAQTVAPSSYSTYRGYFSRSNVARSQDCRPSTSWHRQSRFTFSTISSSFTRFRSTFQTFKSKYF